MTPKIKIFKNKYGNPKFSYVSIIILAGSIYEKEGKRGISHFIEHLIFKGSEYNENLKILNNKLNSKGMIVNAFTTPFITSFHINTPTEYITEAINALVQIVFNPFFRKEDILNERKVVINELLQRQNNPEDLASLKAQQIIYPKKNPLHNPVIGYIKDLKSIDREDVLKYYEKYYCASNMVFVSSTMKSEESVEKIWKNAFNNFGKDIGGESSMDLFRDMKGELGLIGKPGLYRLGRYFRGNETYYVLINFVLPWLSKKDLFGLDIFSNYLAGSLSSKLFIELREKRQLIYGIHSDVDIGVNCVSFNINFNCKKNRKVLYECISTIDRVLKDFYKNGLPIKEFNKFKNKTLINYDKVKGSSMYKINRYIDKFYFGISDYDYDKVIKSITNDYLHNSVKKIFEEKREFVFIV